MSLKFKNVIWFDSEWFVGFIGRGMIIWLAMFLFLVHQNLTIQPFLWNDSFNQFGKHRRYQLQMSGFSLFIFLMKLNETLSLELRWFEFVEFSPPLLSPM